MNIFATNPFPAESAICLPDKHVVKMPLECCQMLSIVASKNGDTGMENCIKQIILHTKLKKVHFEITLALNGQHKLLTMPIG
jgi:hypothetical protein